MIGLDGIGKFTTIELATYICNGQLFRLNIKNGYNYEDFREDLKSVFKLTGIHQKKVVFFIADTDISDVCDVFFVAKFFFKNLAFHFTGVVFGGFG